MDLRIPKKLIDSSGKTWESEFFNKDPQGSNEWKDYFFSYVRKGSNYGASINPIQIETNFSKKDREEPVSKIVQQGRWECGPASLAMFLDIPLWDVKRALVKVGWNNDNYGVSTNMLIEASKLMGFDLVETLDPKNNPCLITVNSLNLKNALHAVYFDGKQLLDPNYKKEGRFYYGTEWGPSTLFPKSPFLVKKESNCEIFTYKKQKV